MSATMVIVFFFRCLNKNYGFNHGFNHEKIIGEITRKYHDRVLASGPALLRCYRAPLNKDESRREGSQIETGGKMNKYGNLWRFIGIKCDFMGFNGI